MTAITRNGDDFTVDATVLAEAFTLDPAEVQPLMRAGQITSRSETGVAADAGLWRLTFHHGTRALRLTVDASGAIVKRTTFTAPKRAPRNPGATPPRP